MAGYDPPYKIINRRNEIWFIKKITDNNENSENGVTDQIGVNENLDNASVDQENNKVNDEISNVENCTQKENISKRKNNQRGMYVLLQIIVKIMKFDIQSMNIK